TPSRSGVYDTTRRDEAPVSGGDRVDQCPLCGRGSPQEWRQAPDRLHGRRELYLLVRCSNCSLVWLSNAPRMEEMHRHYTDSYHRLIAAAGETSPHRWEG